MRNGDDRNKLKIDVLFALAHKGCTPPRTHNIDEQRRYIKLLAAEVVDHLAQTWDFRHKPPRKARAAPQMALQR